MKPLKSFSILELSITIILTGFLTLFLFRGITFLNSMVLLQLSKTNDFNEFYIKCSAIEKMVLRSKSMKLSGDTLCLNAENSSLSYTALFTDSGQLIIQKEGTNQTIELGAKFSTSLEHGALQYKMILYNENDSLAYTYYPIHNTAAEINHIIFHQYGK